MAAGNNMDPREFKFCVEYSVIGNATASAKEAGFPEKSAHVAGSRLLKKDYIQAKIAELQDLASENLVEGSTVTTASLVKELNAAIVDCRKAKQFGPMVRCIELKGKTITAFTDSIATKPYEQDSKQIIDELDAGPIAKALVRHILEGFPADDATVIMLMENHYSDNPVEAEKLRAEVADRQYEQEAVQKRATVPQSPATH